MNKNQKGLALSQSKGFTIIELIVVIAIIAVLAAIVMVNVTSYINKGKDAGIKGNLSTLMTDAAVWVDTPANSGSYAGFCAATFAAGKSIYDAMPQTAAGSKDCNEVAGAWAACSQLIATVGNYFCVDSLGAKREITGTCANTSNATVCPASGNF